MMSNNTIVHEDGSLWKVDLSDVIVPAVVTGGVNVYAQCISDVGSYCFDAIDKTTLFQFPLVHTRAYSLAHTHLHTYE